MWLLHAGGYVEGKEQAPTAIAALDGGIVGVPAVCFVLALLPALFYGRFERLEPQIHAALAQRRAEQPARIARVSAVEVGYSSVDEGAVEIAGGGVAAT
jgi:Na+/melibiose symporter-like transporter